MSLALWLLAVAVAPPRVEALIAELKRPGCPALFDQLVPGFQRAAPRERWPRFCEPFAQVGALQAIAESGSEKGMAVYRVGFEKAEWKLGVAFDGEGRITGLLAQPWPAEAPVATAKTHFRWPLKKPTLVFWGGSTVESNYHVAHARQRRALDLDLVAQDGSTRKGPGTVNSDFVSYGEEVVAAADGVVRVAVDGVPDNVPGEVEASLVPGNLVVIEHAPGEYAHYCHLKTGSTRVKAGAAVKAGQTIGLLGNSGNSSEPHLHFHVQDSVRISEGLGVDAVFYGVCQLREGTVEPMPSYRPRKGDVVVPCE